MQLEAKNQKTRRNILKEKSRDKRKLDYETAESTGFCAE
jgi:hypothetical protein